MAASPSGTSEWAETSKAARACLIHLVSGRDVSLPGHDIIVVGATSGGVEALKTLAAGVPLDLPASCFAWFR